ncbi:MAG: hypothetical protein HY295_04035 [Thaumarchaeota archaeon]|nr:hypothetical protein [Nitrososphaerota archaeon]
MIDLGLVFASFAAVSWGTFFVPVRKVGITNIWQLQGAISVGVILFAIPVGFFWGFDIQIWGILSGIIWSLANLLALYSVKLIGLSRAPPFIAGFGIMISFTWGILFLDETFHSLILALVAVGLLIVGLPLVSGTEKNLLVRKKGFLLAAASGLVGGSYIIPMQASHTLQSGFFSSSLSIFIIGLPLLFLARRFIRKEILSGLMTGGLFNLGSLCALIAVGLLGISLAFPLTQTATLLAVSWGILYFKEVAKKQGIVRVVAGAIAILSGAILLTFA